MLPGSFRYASYKDHKKIAVSLHPIYTAVSQDAAAEALDKFETEWGARYPAIVGLRRDGWEVFVPFLDFPPEVLRVVYTANMIEPINYQPRKVTKTGRCFPDEKAALNLLSLAVRNITTKRRTHRAPEHGDGRRASTHSPSTSQTEPPSHNNDPNHPLTQTS